MLNYDEILKEKICSLDQLKRIVMSHRLLSKKIAFTNGCFDIIHTGHLHYLAKAKSLANILIVGVNSDQSVKKLKGPKRPVFNENDRAFHLASLHVVDYVIIFDEETPLKLIETLQPDVLVKGGDYDPNVEDPDNPSYIVGSDVIKKIGGEVVAIPFLEGYSTTSLIDKIKNI